jgi:hypothetical protein
MFAIIREHREGDRPKVKKKGLDEDAIYMVKEANVLLVSQTEPADPPEASLFCPLPHLAPAPFTRYMNGIRNIGMLEQQDLR